MILLKVENYILIDNQTGVRYKIGDYVNIKTNTDYYKQTRINCIQKDHIDIQNNISINISDILYLCKNERQQ